MYINILLDTEYTLANPITVKSCKHQEPPVPPKMADGQRSIFSCWLGWLGRPITTKQLVVDGQSDNKSAKHGITLCLLAILGGSYQWLFMWVTCPN